MISVTDAPWGAVGDAARVTDGAITSATNTLASATANFVIGQHVDVLGAGAAGGTLFAYVGTGSIGELGETVHRPYVPLHRRTLPRPFCPGRRSRTGLITPLRFRTLMSRSPRLVVGLLVPAARNFLIGKIVPMSGVIVQAYGATIYATQKGSASGFAAQTVAGDAAVVGWSLYGANMPSDGVTYSSGVRAAVYCDVAGSSDIRVEDCQVTNNNDCAFDIAASRVWLVNNRVDTCTKSGGRNAVQIELTTTEDAIDVAIDGNIVSNCATQSIHVGTNGGASMTALEGRMSIWQKTKCSGRPRAGIDMEVGDSGSAFGINDVVS